VKRGVSIKSLFTKISWNDGRITQKENPFHRAKPADLKQFFHCSSSVEDGTSSDENNAESAVNGCILLVERPFLGARSKVSKGKESFVDVFQLSHESSLFVCLKINIL
jgi:hypothetical protein